MLSLSFTPKNNKFVKINMNLLAKYKEEGDNQLINIKRELTRSLVDYRLFQELKNINNSFFVIIRKLNTEEYTSTNDLIEDKRRLRIACEVFTKHCKSAVSIPIYENIFEHCQSLMYTMQKLVEIAKEISREELNL